MTTRLKRNILLVGMLFLFISLSAREVSDFCAGWSFKRGPFPADIYKSQGIWNGKWEAVKIPHTWNAKDMQERYNNFYQGVAYYKKQFYVGEQMRNKRLFLRFEGVGACTEVYVN